ncbi:MAG: AAA family ATPase, partial [Deltaproteobacteria bacterium]|nr:AAA family ATPase [Deltaproteobacteria bacterium]
MLVGRDREVEELEAALAQLATGSGSLVLMAGEPGIGKTRLATEAALRAKARGLRVSWGQCWEAGGAPALWPWREAYQGLGVAFPEARALAGADPAESRFELFRDATAGLLEVAPCVIVLEDLHAADRSTLMLLEFVATQRALPLLVIGTYRELEASLSRDTAASLGRAGRHAKMFVLARLREAEVAALVHDAIADADAKLTASVFATTGGNPLFVGEIVREWRATGATDQIPLGVREVIRQRLALISPEARRVLEIGAVFGVEFAREDVTRIEPRAAAVLEEAQRSGFVTTRGARFRFTHALYREALYHDLVRALRHELHREAALVLRTHGAPLSEIAHHLLEAGPDAAPEAIEHAIRAADQAVAVFAFEDATALLERARSAIPAGADEAAQRCRVMIAQGELQLRSGDAAGRAVCVEAATLARSLANPALLARA